MPRNRVFISYSHNDKDQPFLKDFRVHLKPWEDTEQLNVWSDQRITPSQDWNQEIHKALESTAVAVLLVSPDFLASKYIREVELPALLRAREESQLDLACLYLRSCQVDDMTFEVPLSSGEIVSVKLTQYQGLNSPGAVLNLQEQNTHDAIYSQAASAIKKLFTQRTRTAVRSPTDRYELAIQLKRNGDQLMRFYWSHNGKLTEDFSSWQETHDQEPGQALFQALFDSQSKCDDVLQALFQSELAVPIRYPVRVRIYTDDPQLANLPWSEVSWEGKLLSHSGWTFELINNATLERFRRAPQDLSHITLGTPCSVLLIAPRSTPDAEIHHLALEERLKHTWPSYHEPPLWARNWREATEAWKKRTPRIVYYYGPAESDGKTLTLQFDGQQGVDRRSVTDLTQLWQTDPPQIVFCNLVGSQVSPGVALSGLNVPLAITQNSADPAEARRTALEWLHALLEGNGESDPVQLLYQHGLKRAVAWGSYKTWRTHPNNEPVKEKLARLLLDRTFQRSLGNNAVQELVRDAERRVTCLLACGAEGNLVELFPEQLYEYLRRYTKEIALVRRIPLRLPDAPSFDLPKLEFKVQRFWGLRDLESLRGALEQRAPQKMRQMRPVLLLDWGVRGTTEESRLSSAGLQAWVEFCHQWLSTQCPKDLRILSCLSLELATERHSTLEEIVENLRSQARFQGRAFKLDLLPRLDHVKVSDLREFLEGPDVSCPKGLKSLLPELIVKNTGGRFSQTVELIEQAERTSWIELHHKLVAQSGQSTGGSRTKPHDDLL